MPKNNNHNTLKGLSIHSFADGFSFCTPQQLSFFNSNTSNSSFSDFLDTFLKDNQQIDRIHWVSFEYPSLFVPEPYYDEAYKSRYLEHYTQFNEPFEPHADHLNQQSLFNIYPQNKDVLKTLNEKKRNYSFVHCNTLLFQCIQTETPEYFKEKRFYIHLQKTCFDLFVFEGKGLQLCNRFPYTNTDEFLYYLFFVIEQYQLGTDEYSIVFLGEFNCFDALYKVVKNYHDDVHFITAATAPTTSLSAHQAPYCLNLDLK